MEQTSLSKKNPVFFLKLKKILNITLITILIFIILVFLYIVYFNFTLKRKLDSNDEIIRIKYNFDYMILSNKNKEIINKKNKQLIIYNKKVEYNLNYVKNFNKFYIKINSKKYVINDNEVDALVVNINPSLFDSIDGNIKIKLPNTLVGNELLDIYEINRNSPEIYLKSVKNIDGYINLNLDNNSKVLNYVVTYIPLQDIIINDETIQLNKTQQINLEYKLLPENATDEDVECIANSDIIDIEGTKITGINSGECKVSVKSGNITKDVNIKVNEIANDIIVSSDSVILKIGDSINIEAKVEPENAINSELEWLSDNEKIASVENGKITLNNSGDCNIIVRTKDEPVISKVIAVSSTKIYPAPAKYNVEGLTYINGVLLVNKNYKVPSNFSPGVNQTALAALNDMKKEASKYGFNLNIISSFRSYSTQAGLYQKYTKLYGEDYASVISAKPGTSEHQTGLAFDITSLEQDYADTPEGKWLAQNCARYGFIIRYKKDKENITGYIYEPWHIRYLGTVKAQEVEKSGLCLEEYLGVN